MVSQSTIESLQKIEDTDASRNDAQEHRPHPEVIYVAPAKDDAAHDDSVEAYAESPQQLFDILDDFDYEGTDEVIVHEYVFSRTVKLKRNYEVTPV